MRFQVKLLVLRPQPNRKKTHRQLFLSRILPLRRSVEKHNHPEINMPDELCRSDDYFNNICNEIGGNQATIP